MTIPNRYTAGTTIEIELLLKDKNGVLTDPDTLLVHVRRADGTVEVFTYGTDAEIYRNSVGNFTFFYTPPIGTKSGTFEYGIQAEGIEGYSDVTSRNSFIVLDWRFD